LLTKRFDSLKEIERLVGDAKSKDSMTLEGDQELKQLALQGDELLKRVEAAARSANSSRL